MKRLIALLLTLVLVMSLFAACDSGKKKDKDDDDDETTEATDVVSTDDVVKPIVDPTDDNTGNAVPKPYPGADASKDGIEGTWELKMDASELLGEEAAGFEVTMTLEIDGATCSLTSEVLGQSDVQTGTVDGNILNFDGEELTATVNGSEISVVDSEGVTMVFTRK